METSSSLCPPPNVTMLSRRGPTLGRVARSGSPGSGGLSSTLPLLLNNHHHATPVLSQLGPRSRLPWRRAWMRRRAEKKKKALGWMCSGVRRRGEVGKGGGEGGVLTMLSESRRSALRADACFFVCLFIAALQARCDQKQGEKEQNEVKRGRRERYSQG